MSAPRLPWIKFWPELFDHEKFASLSDAEAWTWVVVWGKASLQAKRWRFASIEHAHKVTGRPMKHLRRLVELHLIDEGTDGVHIHNAPKWQDKHPSDYSVKPPPSLRESSVNAASSVPRARVEGEGDREGDREIEEDVTPPGGQSLLSERPTSANGNGHLSKNLPKGSAAVKEAFKLAGLEAVVFEPRDHHAIKHSNAEPALIAEVYVAVARREYGDDFMRKQLSVHAAIGWINGYVKHKSHAENSDQDPLSMPPCPGCQRINWNPSDGPVCEPCARAGRGAA